MPKTLLAVSLAALTLPLAALAQPPATGRAPEVPAAPPAPAPSKAERITHIRDTIERGRSALAKMEQRLDDPTGEYAKAKAEFEDIDKRFKAEQDAIADLKEAGKADEAKTREDALKPLADERKDARDRFDLAIRQRKASQDAMAALKQRVEQEQKELDRLEGNASPAPAQVPAAGPTPASGEPAPPAAVPAIPGMPLPLPAPAAGPPPAPAPRQEDPAVKKAREKVEARQNALHEAEELAKTTGERVDALKNTMKAVTRVLEAEREAGDLTQQTLTRLSAQLESNPPNDFWERQELAGRIAEAGNRLAESRTRIKRLTDRLEELNGELHGLEGDQIAALKEAEARRKEVDEAGRELANITNPFTPRNALRWAAAHGPNLLGILAVTCLLYLAVRMFSRHIVRVVTRTNNRGSEEDRENRANTLVGVFRYAAGLFVLGGGAVMLLDEAGIPIVPLMGGAAVLGLAVAFGAQNLIKDYFSGFMMLMEDQYGVNDVVKIGATAGLVEAITLRVTVLRDLEGMRHFIPHGSVTQVSNMTHTWSRAVFDVPLAYGEDVDRAMDVLLQLARELRSDPQFAPYILDEAEMLGVDAFDSSAVIVKFLIKTRPLKQWLVKREMLRRIRNRFDQLGIAHPFPHRMVYHKFPDAEKASPPASLRWPA